jgi:hypothetical protein
LAVTTMMEFTLQVDTEILRGIPFHKVLQQPRLWLSPSASAKWYNWDIILRYTFDIQIMHHWYTMIYLGNWCCHCLFLLLSKINLMI